jgi:hypothetical protein
MHDVQCPFTGATFRVQFWATHQENSLGDQRMAIAVFSQNTVFPTRWNLLGKTSQFWRSPLYAFGGRETAIAAVNLVLERGCFDDICLSDTETPAIVSKVSVSDEGAWL